MVMNRPTNNAQNSGVDSETTRDVLNRLDRTIRILEGELAKPNPFGTRAQLIGQLREAKALKVSLETAVQTGALKMNEALFNNKGMPTAKPGSFIESVLKRAEASFGLFSNQFSINKGGYGPYKGEFAFNNNGARKPAKMMPNKGPPAYLVNKGNKGNRNNNGGNNRGNNGGNNGGGFADPKGPVGSAYPGLNGYIFGKDGTTPVQKVPARPVPNMWPHTDASHYIYNESLSPIPVKPGTKVPGTVKTYYGGAPLELGGGASMPYPDGTYQGVLEQPPSPVSITVSQSTSGSLYIPSPGDAVVGNLAKTHVHGADKSGSPLAFEVAANIPWIGVGTSHVFTSNGTPLQKAAGVVVPGQSSQVYSEALNPLTVSAGVFVPGSGVHDAGGSVRTKVYTSSTPAEQLAWQAGADVPWVSNVKSRFDSDGTAKSFNIANAYPGQANTVFNSDYSAYQVAPGKEVPGSVGYDRSQALDADGLGPAASVYNASLQPVEKTRGLLVPGAGGKGERQVYESGGGGATITTVRPGDALILQNGVSPESVYSMEFLPLVKESGVIVPGTPVPGSQVYQALEPGNPATSVVRDLATRSAIVQIPDPNFKPKPGSEEPPPMIEVVRHQVAFMPSSGKPIEIKGQPYVPYAFDPAMGMEPGKPEQTRIEQGQAPGFILFPGDSHQSVIKQGQFPTRDGSPLFVARSAEALRTGEFIRYAEGLSEITNLAKQLQPANALTVVNNASGDGGTALSIQLNSLKGSRSLMFKQGFGASTSTTSSSRSSGGFRNFMNDPRVNGRWF